ncbi:MAG: hypothetical protein ACFE8U_14130 [Candidatus Hermodarchaeota archaeon]
MDEVKFGPKNIPLLLHGTSPFIGAGQFGPRARKWYEYFFHHPKRIAELFNHFCEQGFPGVHVIGYPTIIEAAKLTKENNPLKVTVSLLPKDWEENLTQVAQLEPEVVFIHGAMTDNFLQKHDEKIFSCFQAIRDQTNAFPGIATHNTFQTLLSSRRSSHPLFKEDFGLLLPINASGWGMGVSPAKIIDLLSTHGNHPVIAMKTLAAGQLSPENALEFVFKVPQVKAATVGMTTKEEAIEIASIGRKLLLEKQKI